MKARRRGVATIVAAVLMGAALTPAAAQADVPDDGIAFTRGLETGGADVFVTRADGTGTVHVPLSYPAEDFGLPVWPPDGGHLLVSHVFRFDGNGDFLPFRPVIVRPDGSNETLLEIPDGPDDMFCATWASNDRLFCAFGEEADGVYTVRADGRVVDSFDANGCDAAVDNRDNVFVSGCGTGQTKVFDAGHRLIGASDGGILLLRFGPDGRAVALDCSGAILFLTVTLPRT